jgi:hypothetical protein
MAAVVEQRSQINGDHKSLAAKTNHGGRIFTDQLNNNAEKYILYPGVFHFRSFSHLIGFECNECGRPQLFLQNLARSPAGTRYEVSVSYNLHSVSNWAHYLSCRGHLYYYNHHFILAGLPQVTGEIGADIEPGPGYIATCSGAGYGKTTGAVSRSAAPDAAWTQSREAALSRLLLYGSHE